MLDSEARCLAGLRLKAARIALGYNAARGRRTATAFYKEIQASSQAGSNWEHGAAYPNHKSLLRLYERFEIDPNWILLGRPGSLPERLAGSVVETFNKIKDNGP